MEKKFKGTLLGLAVGDALGGPLEFMSNNQIQIKHGTVSSMIGGGWLNLRPGQYTEDTILMMAIAESLIEYKEPKPEEIIQRYQNWARTNPKDISNLTKSVLMYIREGGKLQDAARKAYEELPRQSDPNDILPWCVPLALLYFQEPEKLMQFTLKTAMLTHYDKKVASGAVVVNLIIARILNGETDRKKILAQVSQLLDDNECGVYNILPDVAGKTVDDLRPSARMQDTLETAIWGWLKTKSFQEAIVTVINAGGDADTIGAVTGAIAGAYYGEEAIPADWLKFLEDKNIIAGLAKRLFKLVSKHDA